MLMTVYYRPKSCICLIVLVWLVRYNFSCSPSINGLRMVLVFVTSRADFPTRFSVTSTMRKRKSLLKIGKLVQGRLQTTADDENHRRDKYAL